MNLVETAGNCWLHLQHVACKHKGTHIEIYIEKNLGFLSMVKFIELYMLGTAD